MPSNWFGECCDSCYIRADDNEWGGYWGGPDTLSHSSKHDKTSGYSTGAKHSSVNQDSFVLCGSRDKPKSDHKHDPSVLHL
ncbi:hypothetical protein TNCT_95091 [Trichonephila clavata]|uniref:Uncharacterized protein n=1 Tax=Trichonephila clavata TaxID=2740835 RepID=A0A8X6KFV5_TRICU|nr:hypothetical protein TNCT_95091 [Trichonephila clavata]